MNQFSEWLTTLLSTRTRTLAVVWAHFTGVVQIMGLFAFKDGEIRFRASTLRFRTVSGWPQECQARPDSHSLLCQSGLTLPTAIYRNPI